MNSNNAQYGSWGFQREDLGPGLITAGLSMLANNDGRLNAAQLIGQGGYDALAGLQWRKQYEAEMARQQMEDDRVQQAHDMQMAQSQMQMDEAARRAELERMAASGDDSAIKALAPLEWWKHQQAKAAADLQHQRDLEVAGIKAGAKSEPKLSDVSGLGKRWASESTDYLETGKTLEAMIDFADQKSGAGDLGMIFSYMKMLDPTSVVREGEQVQAVKTSNISDQLWATYEKVASGQKLTPTQRRNFIRSAKGRFDTLGKTQTKRNDYFRGIADAYNIDPALVITDLYAGLGDKSSSWLEANPEVSVFAPPAVAGIPGVLSSAPSHSNAPKVRIWNPQKGDFD